MMTLGTIRTVFSKAVTKIKTLKYKLKLSGNTKPNTKGNTTIRNES